MGGLMMSVCTSVVKLETFEEDVDMMLVTIDEHITAYMVGNYATCLEFIGQEVIVNYRKDIYKGKLETFINTLTIPLKVNVLSRDTNLKLYSNITDNNSNVCFADILEGECVYGAIMYCVESLYESSPSAAWLTCKVRDKAGRVSKIRLFDYDIRNINYSGMYIKADIRKTLYGFNTKEIVPIPSDFPINPEVDICKTYIQNYFADDTYIKDLFSRTQLLEYMEGFIAEERGYSLVRAAIELDILSSLKNCFDDINFKAVAYAVIMRYGYITLSSKSDYSSTLKTLTFVLTNRVPSELSRHVLLTLDRDAEITSERLIFEHILDMANSIIRIKKEG